jgi:hypothetical protein
MRLFKLNSLLFMVFILLNCTLAFTQSVTVRSFAEPNIIGRNEELAYTIEVSGDKGFKVTAPKLPELADFSMKSMMTTSASNYSMMNGNVSESVTKSFIYSLVPKRTGNLKIPAFNISVNGKGYSTQAVNVRVLDKSYAGNKRSPQSNSFGFGQSNPLNMQSPFDMNYGFEPVGDISIVAVPSKRSVYVGEPVLVTYRLYTNQMVTSLELKDEQDFGGYGKEAYSESSRLNFEPTKYKNMRYQTSELKTLAISPNRAGEIQLPQLTADVQMGNMGLFSKTIQSEPLKITVMELPLKDKPLDFSGAVGSFKVSEKIDKTAIRVGDAFEYKLVISGRGNFNQFSNPAYHELQDFRIASPLTDDQIQAGVSGTRTIRYLLIPKREGKFTLPGIAFNWFDPATGRYMGFRGKAIYVEVRPGNVLTYISNVFQKENVKLLSTFNPKASYKSQSLIANSSLYWLLVILVILSLLPSWWFAAKRKLRDTDPELAAQRGSSRVLKKYLKQAEDAAHFVSKDFYPKAEQGLMRYLSDKYHIPHRFSTSEKIYQMHLKGLDEELILSLEVFLKRCQEARFMPGGFNEVVLQTDLETLKKIVRAFSKQANPAKKRMW